MSHSQPIRVIIADTAFLIRKGLRMLIKENPAFEYVTEVADPKSLISALKQHPADVLIVDHCCDDCFSLKEISKIKRAYPQLNILVISHEKTIEEIESVVGIGIQNYLLKDCDEHELTDAITYCAKGIKYFCGQIVDVLIEKETSVRAHCKTGGISERELEIIQKLVSGKRPKEIAEVLCISPFTVTTHKRNIYKKLGISHSYELAQYANRTGLLS